MKAEKTRYHLDRCSYGGEHMAIWELEETNKELSELERKATEYESNKHYIELGKAVKEAFENGYTLDAWEYDEMDELKLFESISNENDLLEWAEGRE